MVGDTNDKEDINDHSFQSGCLGAGIGRR